MLFCAFYRAAVLPEVFQAHKQDTTRGSAQQDRIKASPCVCICARLAASSASSTPLSLKMASHATQRSGQCLILILIFTRQAVGGLTKAVSSKHPLLKTVALAFTPQVALELPFLVVAQKLLVGRRCPIIISAWQQHTHLQFGKAAGEWCMSAGAGTCRQAK